MSAGYSSGSYCQARINQSGGSVQMISCQRRTLYRAAVAVRERELLHEHAKAERARAHDILDLEVDEVHARVVHLLDDLRELARRRLDGLLGLTARADQLAVGEEHGRGGRVRQLHQDAVLLGHELGAAGGLGVERRQVEAHAQVRRADVVAAAR